MEHEETIAEKRARLRAELAELGDSEPEAAPKEAPKEEAPEFTHYVHLADGRVVKHDLARNSGNPFVNGNHFVEGEVDDDGTDNRTQTLVIGVYPR